MGSAHLGEAMDVWERRRRIVGPETLIFLAEGLSLLAKSLVQMMRSRWYGSKEVVVRADAAYFGISKAVLCQPYELK